MFRKPMKNNNWNLWFKKKNTDTNMYQKESGTIGNVTHCWWECKMYSQDMENDLGVSTKVGHRCTQ